MDRRMFLQTMSGWSLGALLAAMQASDRQARADGVGYVSPGFQRKPVPGACIQPQTSTEQTLAAVLDTVVPGPQTDPEGSPGALEACSLNVLLDSTFPFLQYADLFAGMIDQISIDAHGVPFVALAYAQRLEVLAAAAEKIPLLRLAYRAIRSAFFGGAYNGVGLDYVGYPGPNLGYRHVPECSFRTPVCQELTSDGRMP